MAKYFNVWSRKFNFNLLIFVCKYNTFRIFIYAQIIIRYREDEEYTSTRCVPTQSRLMPRSSNTKNALRVCEKSEEKPRKKKSEQNRDWCHHRLVRVFVSGAELRSTETPSWRQRRYRKSKQKTEEKITNIFSAMFSKSFEWKKVFFSVPSKWTHILANEFFMFTFKLDVIIALVFSSPFTHKFAFIRSSSCADIHKLSYIRSS